MNEKREGMARIAIIGGGATGLGAAFLLKRASEAGADVEFDLYERDSRLGGKVAGEIVPDPETGEPFIIDGGPDCFTARKPAAMRVAKLAGIEDQKLPSQESKKGTYIWRGDRKYHLPEGFSMFVPTQLAPVFETGLLTEEGKRELLRDLVVPKKKIEPDAFNDETLESFIVRRFGREVLDYLAEPFIGGVHASAPETMSLRSSFPMYLDMEQKYGSVIRGTVMGMKAREKAAAGKPKDPNNTMFATFRLGLHQLTDAMADAAGREHLHTGCAVSSVRAEKEGSSTRYVIDFEDGSRETFDGVVIATESYAAARMLKDMNPEMAQAYEGIPNLTSSTCSFGFRAGEITLPESGFGTLVPAVENRALLAATWSSIKWSNRAPEGRVLIRGFAGTPHNQDLMEKSDEEITAIVLSELKEIMDIKPDAEPLFSRFYRWTLGMSQYTMGHLDRVETIERICENTHGLAAAGGCFHGVGVPNCIAGGEKAALKLLADCGIDYFEEIS